MDPTSPFASREGPTTAISSSLIIHVNFCNDCHYVWKAPAPAQKCVNCIQPTPNVVSLVTYRTEVPLT